ncbi:hypothetical protein M91_14343, partial [Bos mutus]
ESFPQMKYEEMQAEDNMSTVIQFALPGFSDLPNRQGILFGVFTITYIIILIGSSLLIIITWLDPALHKPTYFFLANFSFLEICYVPDILPRILVNLWTQDRSISVLDCATQVCFFLMLEATECFLLAVMTYDRCVAICDPLHYPLVMIPKTCLQLTVGSWVSGIPVQIGQRCQISLHFCHSNEISHFFCDIPPILKLACGDTFAHELSVYAVALLFVAVPFMLILSSYSKIISTILRFPTARGGRKKTFSTCASHLTSVAIYQGTLLFVYSRPSYLYSPNTDKIISVFYTIIIPVRNPLIYSLRNKDVKDAAKKVLKPKINSS